MVQKSPFQIRQDPKLLYNVYYLILNDESLIRFALFTFKNAPFIYNCLGIPQEKVERGHWTHPNILFGRFPIEIETQIAGL